MAVRELFLAALILSPSGLWAEGLDGAAFERLAQPGRVEVAVF